MKPPAVSLAGLFSKPALSKTLSMPIDQTVGFPSFRRQDGMKPDRDRDIEKVDKTIEEISSYESSQNNSVSGPNTNKTK